MMKFINKIFHMISHLIFNLPSPKNLSFFWNMGSMLGFIFIFQMLTGIFLSFFYSSDFSLAFNSLEYVMRSPNNGFILRWIHMNFASFFFLFIYIHMFRGLYFFSFKFSETWNSGVVILIILMMIAFLGYVLPWGQMSFWAATVITKFFSVIPFLGTKIVCWMWGGYSVFGLTLKFFFSLHFIFPFILLVLIMIHLINLHFFGSSNSSFMESKNKKMFSYLFVYKDLLNMVVIFFLFFSFFIWFSSESVNFIKSNPVSSPPHIKPEWYFLFAYAILRSVPDKLTGVIMMGFSLIIFFFISFISLKLNFSNIKIFNTMLFWFFISNFIFLSWVGGNPVTDLFVLLGMISTCLYFFFFKILLSLYYFFEEVLLF